MDTILLANARRLSDRELLRQVKQLAQHERAATARLIAHLAELEARRLYLAEGCSSLFGYCTQVLHLSEHAAYGRIEAARAARKFPLILARLADGSVTLTTVGLLAPHLTAENHQDLLDATHGASKREVEELVVRLRPQPPVPDAVRKLPIQTSATDHLVALLTAVQGATGARAQTEEQTPSPTPPPIPTRPPAPRRARPAVVAPLAPERYSVRFTATAALHAKLRQAQALLRHQIPNGDLEQIFDRALTVLLRELTKQKHAATERPRPENGSNGPVNPGSRHVPAVVKRAVWARDGGRCAFAGAHGRRCTEEGFLEFHHVVPYARGGRATVDNIELRCRAHNGYEAEHAMGARAAVRVRETRARYGVTAARSRRRRTIRSTGSGPSSLGIPCAPTRPNKRGLPMHAAP
jgi:hypothetical protein